MNKPCKERAEKAKKGAEEDLMKDKKREAQTPSCNGYRFNLCVPINPQLIVGLSL